MTAYAYKWWWSDCNDAGDRCRCRLTKLLHSVWRTITIRWHEGCSNFLNLFANHDGIVTPNFCSTEFSVIERTFVLVTVSMYRAEQSSAPALESFVKEKQKKKKRNSVSNAKRIRQTFENGVVVVKRKRNIPLMGPKERDTQYLPVNPTFLRQVAQRFFFFLASSLSPSLSSLSAMELLLLCPPRLPLSSALIFYRNRIKRN